MAAEKCPTCHGRGYTENVAWWDGRAECGTCDGVGVALDTVCAYCGDTLEQHLDEERACDFLPVEDAADPPTPSETTGD